MPHHFPSPRSPRSSPPMNRKKRKTTEKSSKSRSSRCWPIASWQLQRSMSSRPPSATYLCLLLLWWVNLTSLPSRCQLSLLAICVFFFLVFLCVWDYFISSFVVCFCVCCAYSFVCMLVLFHLHMCHRSRNQLTAVCTTPKELVVTLAVSDATQWVQIQAHIPLVWSVISKKAPFSHNSYIPQVAQMPALNNSDWKVTTMNRRVSLPCCEIGCGHLSF